MAKKVRLEADIPDDMDTNDTCAIFRHLGNAFSAWADKKNNEDGTSFKDGNMTEDESEISVDIYYDSSTYTDVSPDFQKATKDLPLFVYFGILALAIIGGTLGTILGTIFLGKIF